MVCYLIAVLKTKKVQTCSEEPEPRVEPDCHLQKYPSGTGELEARNHLHMSRLQMSRKPKEKSDFTLMEYAFFSLNISCQF